MFSQCLVDFCFQCCHSKTDEITTIIVKYQNDKDFQSFIFDFMPLVDIQSKKSIDVLLELTTLYDGTDVISQTVENAFDCIILLVSLPDLFSDGISYEYIFNAIKDFVWNGFSSNISGMKSWVDHFSQKLVNKGDEGKQCLDIFMKLVEEQINIFRCSKLKNCTESLSKVSFLLNGYGIRLEFCADDDAYYRRV